MMTPFEKAEEILHKLHQDKTCLLACICPECGWHLTHLRKTKHSFLGFEWETSNDVSPDCPWFMMECLPCNRSYEIW